MPEPLATVLGWLLYELALPVETLPEIVGLPVSPLLKVVCCARAE